MILLDDVLATIVLRDAMFEELHGWPTPIEVIAELPETLPHETRHRGALEWWVPFVLSLDLY